jgi:hypothetical protein
LATWRWMTKITGSSSSAFGSGSISPTWIRGSGSTPKCHRSGTLENSRSFYLALLRRTADRRIRLTVSPTLCNLVDHRRGDNAEVVVHGKACLDRDPESKQYCIVRFSGYRICRKEGQVKKKASVLKSCSKTFKSCSKIFKLEICCIHRQNCENKLRIRFNNSFIKR